MSRKTRRKRWGGILLAVLALLAAGGAWRLSLRRQPGETAATALPMDPEEQALRAAADRNPRDASARQALGRCLLSRRRPYEAMWAFQDSLELRSGEGEARRGLARALVMAQLPRRALEVLAERAASPGVSPSAARGRGDEELEDRRVAAAAYLAMGDPQGAVTMMEAVGPSLDRSAPALLDLGNAYEVLGDDDAAAAAYRRLVRLQAESLEGQLALARVSARRESWGEVLPALRQVRRIEPDDLRPLYHLAETLERRGPAWGEEESRASGIPRPTPEAIYGQILQRHPEDGGAHLRLGLRALRRGQAGLAATHLERAVAARAGGEETRLRLAAACEAVGRKAEAAYHRGRYWEITQEPHRAIVEYRRLAELDPGRKDVPLLLSAVYNQMDMNERAAEVARRGFERHPEDLPIRARYAMLLMIIDDRDRAAALCRRWLKEHPEWAEPYRLLGRMARESLRPAEAVRLDELAMARDPRNAEYCLEAARALAALPRPSSGDATAHFRRAAATLRRGMSLDPKNAEIHLRLGEMLERLGDLDGARLQYLRSMDRERALRFGAYALSRLCYRLKKAPRARFYAENVRALRERQDAGAALWRQVYQSPADAETHARLADLSLQAGDTRQALYQLQQAVRLRPDPNRQRELQILRRLQSMREG